MRGSREDRVEPIVRPVSSGGWCFSSAWSRKNKMRMRRMKALSLRIPSAFIALRILEISDGVNRMVIRSESCSSSCMCAIVRQKYQIVKLFYCANVRQSAQFAHASRKAIHISSGGNTGEGPSGLLPQRGSQTLTGIPQSTQTLLRRQKGRPTQEGCLDEAPSRTRPCGRIGCIRMDGADDEASGLRDAGQYVHKRVGS